jgi:hypothetical protein
MFSDFGLEADIDELSHVRDGQQTSTFSTGAAR